MVFIYLGRRLDESLFFFIGGDHRYHTQGLLFIALSITRQHTLGVRAIKGYRFLKMS